MVSEHKSMSASASCPTWPVTSLVVRQTCWLLRHQQSAFTNVFLAIGLPDSNVHLIISLCSASGSSIGRKNPNYIVALWTHPTSNITLRHFPVLPANIAINTNDEKTLKCTNYLSKCTHQSSVMACRRTRRLVILYVHFIYNNHYILFNNIDDKNNSEASHCRTKRTE